MHVLCWNMVEFLVLMSSKVITQILTKFNSVYKDLEFIRFYLKANVFTPNTAMMEAIKNLPWPDNITGVRAWFGLVEQVAYDFSKTSYGTLQGPPPT